MALNGVVEKVVVEILRALDEMTTVVYCSRVMPVERVESSVCFR